MNKGPGRPPIVEGSRLSRSISFRVSEDDYWRLKELAAMNDRKLGEQARIALLQGLNWECFWAELPPEVTMSLPDGDDVALARSLVSRSAPKPASAYLKAATGAGVYEWQPYTSADAAILRRVNSYLRDRRSREPRD